MGEKIAILFTNVSIFKIYSTNEFIQHKVINWKNNLEINCLKRGGEGGFLK